jgi:hypothetical protein
MQGVLVYVLNLDGDTIFWPGFKIMARITVKRISGAPKAPIKDTALAELVEGAGPTNIYVSEIGNSSR